MTFTFDAINALSEQCHCCFRAMMLLSACCNSERFAHQRSRAKNAPRSAKDSIERFWPRSPENQRQANPRAAVGHCGALREWERRPLWQSAEDTATPAITVGRP